MGRSNDKEQTARKKSQLQMHLSRLFRFSVATQNEFLWKGCSNNEGSELAKLGCYNYLIKGNQFN